MKIRASSLSVLLVLLSSSLTVQASPSAASNPLLKIHAGQPIVVDGIADKTEWKDAHSLALKIKDVLDLVVLYKHDCQNVYLAYVVKKGATEELWFPELFVDPNNDKTTQWSQDDLWFHVSGTDCEAKGKHSDYSNCKIVQPGWKAVPNYQLSENPPPISEIEISIPISKLNVGLNERFGLMLSLYVVPEMRTNDPDSGDIDSPETWGEAILVAK